MELETTHSSGVAKAGLTTGIIGTALSVLGAVGNGVLGASAVNAAQSSCSEDHLINRYELGYEQKVAQLETQLALKDAEINSSNKTQQLYNYVDQRFNAIETQLSNQAVQNQANADSFSMVTERMNNLNNSLVSQIAAEAHERRCCDNTLVSYMNATFYPKMVADVTTGTSTTAQVVYNPLPSEVFNSAR